MRWRKLTGLIVVGVSLAALVVALLGLRAGVGAQPSSVGEEPVCAADASATAAARTQEETEALGTIYGTGLEALAPGGARLCVTAAEMAAEAQAEEGVCNSGVERAVEAPTSCVVGEAPGAERPSGLCGEADAACSDRPDCGA